MLIILKCISPVQLFAIVKINIPSTHGDICMSITEVKDSVIGADDLLKLATVYADLEPRSRSSNTGMS